MKFLGVLLLFLMVGIFLFLPLQRGRSFASRYVDHPNYANMVLIPAGDFIMGCNEGSGGEKPPHRVYVDAFFMDKFEVTNAQFEKFVIETGYKPQGEWRKYYQSGRESHPVVNVTWYDAIAYLAWEGKRLPTEAEWEKATRGSLEEKKYPWGNEIDFSKANYGGKKGGTTPVGSYAANAYGLFDMAGNALEWVADWYQQNFYVESPYLNPRGPSSGVFRVLRGGGWDVGFHALRCAARNWNPPDFWDN